MCEAILDKISWIACSKIRNSDVADKPRDTFVQMQWHGWPPKICTSPYVLPCWIWSFCVKGRRHKYRRTPKLGEPWNSALLGWEARLTPTYTPLPDMCYHVKFGSSATNSVRVNRREPQKLGSAGTPPPWSGVWLKSKTSPLPICVTTLNLVVLRQRVYA